MSSVEMMLLSTFNRFPDIHNKCILPLVAYIANSMDPDQAAFEGAA